MERYNHIWLKWLDGSISSEEEAELQADPDYSWMMGHLSAAKDFEVPPFNQAEVWEAVQQKTEAARRKPLNRRIPLWTISAAASVLLLALVWWGLGQRITTISTGVGEQVQHTLPDGSEVQLNAAAQIKYRKRGWKQNRAVQLNGEAFFEVHRPGPFVVRTKNSEVAVLGTSFSVKDRNNHVEVACFTGGVQVTHLPDDALVRLAKGEAIRYEPSLDAQRFDVSGDTQPQWTTGRSTFNNVPLTEVLDEMSRHYQIQFLTGNAQLERRFSGSFIHSDLDLALKMVLEPMDIRWRKTGNQVVLSQ